MSFVGFDQSGYPGDSSMSWLKANAAMAVTGFYLGPAPYHGDTSWMGQRSDLAQQGWGFLPVYVGLQSGDPNLGAARGASDAAGAAALMQQAGFPGQSVVFLDIETGGPISSAFEAYVDAWIAALPGKGFTPGLYCSHVLMNWAGPKTGHVWTFHLPANTNGQTYSPAGLPAGAIDPGAVATQYRQNVYISGYGHGAVDLNVCASADPSKP